MSLPYGYAKAKVVSTPFLKAKPGPNETQYHLHFGITVAGAPWDVAVNVGTNDSDDLLKYKLVFDFQHAILAGLKASAAGQTELTNTQALPALDFQRSDILVNTGAWRASGIMDGSMMVEPVASLQRLLVQAQQTAADVYVFGRFYSEGNGLHDTHMNQGSTGSFIHRPGDDSNDHNDIWQDGAVLVDLGTPQWAAYFAAFEQQLLPTDALGNPAPGAMPIT